MLLGSVVVWGETVTEVDKADVAFSTNSMLWKAVLPVCIWACMYVRHGIDGVLT